MLAYPADMSKDDDGISVRVPDIPGTNTAGDTEDEAREMAVDAITIMLDGIIRERKEIPAPSPPTVDQVLIALPSIIEAKVMLYRAMREQGVSKAEMNRRMNAPTTTADRLLDLYHGSKMDVLDRAFEALGTHMDISLRRIA